MNKQLQIFAIYAFTMSGCTAIQAQQVTVNASSAITIPAGAFFGTGGGMDIQPSSNVDNDGTLAIEGDFINDGGTFDAGTGDLTLSGGGSSQQLRTNTGTLYDLTINKTSGKITLGDDVTITHNLTLTSGNIETGLHQVKFSSSSLDPVESSTSRIIGTSYMDNRAVGIGASLNFLGLSIGSGVDDLGDVFFTRVTGDGTNGNPNGIVGVGPNNSISCYWDITASIQPASGRDITFHWLSDLDNSHDFNGAKAIVWKNDGSSWASFGSSAYASGPSPYWTSPTVTTTSFSKWTITSIDQPLPITLLDFTAKCSNNKVNLNWSTASETNNNFFTVERSGDYYSFEKVVDFPGAGNSNHLLTYSAIDDSPFAGNSFYRLKQTDYNGAYTYSNVIPVSCKQEQDFNLISVIPGQHEHEILMTFEAAGGEQYDYSVFDITGKLMKKETGSANPGVNEVHINMGSISEGLYLVTLQNNEKSFTRKIVLK